MEKDPCSVCGGTGKPVSGLRCICGGKGTQAAEVDGLRQRIFDLERALKPFADLAKVFFADIPPKDGQIKLPFERYVADFWRAKRVYYGEKD